MKLSAHEQKYIARLLRNRRNHVWLRWVKLLLAGLLFTVGLWSLTLIGDATEAFFLEGNQHACLVVALISPVCMLLIALSAVMAAYTLHTWNGEIGKELLLRLVQLHEDGSPSSSPFRQGMADAYEA